MNIFCCCTLLGFRQPLPLCSSGRSVALVPQYFFCVDYTHTNYRSSRSKFRGCFQFCKFSIFIVIGAQRDTFDSSVVQQFSEFSPSLALSDPVQSLFAFQNSFNDTVKQIENLSFQRNVRCSCTFLSSHSWKINSKISLYRIRNKRKC